MENSTWMVWMVLAAFFIIVEIFTAGFFILWFGVGAAAAGAAAMLGLSFGWQLGIFIVISLALFLMSRKISAKLVKAQPPGIGADRFREQDALVIEEINNQNGKGRVRVKSEEWRAESADGSVIAENSTVRVVNVSGTRLIVQLKEKERL